MGHSPSISKMMKKEKAFDDWIAKRKEALEAKEAELQKAQDTAIGDFYSENSWNDAKAICSGSNTDFQHQQDFTMKNLKKIIDAIGAAMFSDSAAPAGSKTDPDEAAKAIAAAKKMGGEIGDAASVELLIASKVFDVLSGVIMAFGTSTKLSYTHTYKSVSLGYGMQLFCTVAASTFSSSDFFNDENIFEYLYIYEVRFSLDQAEKEGERMLIAQYQDAIAAFESRLEELDKEVEENKLSGEQYEDQSGIWTKMINQNEDELKKLQTEKYKTSLAMH